MIRPRPMRKWFGLTVLEWSIIAITILALIFILLPASSPHNHSMRGSMTRVRAVMQAFETYAENNREHYPPRDDWKNTIQKLGLVDSRLLDERQADGSISSFVYLGGLRTMDSKQIVVYELAEPRTGWGVFAGFADGHVERIENGDFDRMLAAQLAKTTPAP